MRGSGFFPPEGDDCAPAAIRWLDELRRGGQRRCVLPPGVHHFWPDRARERYLFVSNNDEGLKRIAFDLAGLNDLEIDGQGARLVFHGSLVPFVLEGCRDLVLRNLSVDWAVPFHDEATVEDCGDWGVDIRPASWVRHRVEDERLVFLDEQGCPRRGIKNILEFDAERRETAFRAPDNYFIGRGMRALDRGEGRLRLLARFGRPRPQPGNTLVIADEGRHIPAFVLSHSASIRLADVTIHHAGGMGVIAQRCRDVALERVVVTPSAGRTISATADATHFVHCCGEVRVLDCRFFNQMDDAANVHGIYARLERKLDAHTAEFRLMHHQQLGFILADVGDRMQFVRGGSLAAVDTGIVRAVTVLNKEIVVLEFTAPLPELTPGDAATNLTWSADFTLRGCRMGGNRARGVLVTTPRTVLIEENHFHTPGSAVLIEGDVNYWYESGTVQDVTIRGNTFDRCLYGVWGKAVVQVSPRVADAAPPCHRNIRVLDNTFITSDPRLLCAAHVEGLHFAGNRIQKSDAYPADESASQRFNIHHCRDVQVQDNEPAVITLREEVLT